MEGFLMRGWDLKCPLRERRNLDVVPRGETLAARWLHESQSIINQPVELGFPRRVGPYRPGGSPFSPPGRLKL